MDRYVVLRDTVLDRYRGLVGARFAGDYRDAADGLRRAAVLAAVLADADDVMDGRPGVTGLPVPGGQRVEVASRILRWGLNGTEVR